MRNKETFGLLKSADEIRVALDTDGDRVGGLLNENDPLPVGEGEPAFDYRQHMRQLIAQLDRAEKAAVASEDDHAGQLIRVSRTQSERNEIVRTHVDKLVATRQGLEGLYRRGGFELASLAGDTPRAPAELLEQLEQTVKLLRQPAVELRELRMRGFDVDLETVASELEAGMPDLRSIVDRLAKRRKQAEGLFLAKREARKVFRRTILWVGRATEGLFHLAGESELADRIRKSTRRPLRPSEEEPVSEDEPAEESASADESGSESGTAQGSLPAVPASEPRATASA